MADEVCPLCEGQGSGLPGYFGTMADSAQRAVLKASPILALREYVDDYNEWRNVKMRFKPPV